MSSAVRAVVFDLDGTLFDHAGASARAVADFLLSVGVAATPALRAAWAEAEGRHFERWRLGEIDFTEQRRARLVEVLLRVRFVGHGAKRALLPMQQAVLAYCIG